MEPQNKLLTTPYWNVAHRCGSQIIGSHIFLVSSDTSKTSTENRAEESPHYYINPEVAIREPIHEFIDDEGLDLFAVFSSD